MPQKRSPRDEPALFDLPPQPPPTPASQPGRARETYARTVAARVTIIDEPALRDAAARAAEECIVIAVFDDEDAGEEDAGDEDSVAAALEMLVEPTAGLWPLLEDGAVRVVDLKLSTEDIGPTEYDMAWTVTVKLHDVRAVREIALRGWPPDDAVARTEVGASFAAAWNRAAEPYKPVRDVPGIRWEGRGVTVEHVPARANRQPGTSC